MTTEIECRFAWWAAAFVFFGWSVDEGKAEISPFVWRDDL